MVFDKIAAFIKKDFILESSYKLAFLLRIFTVFTSILVYFFIDRLFGNRIVEDLEPFGVNYFSYVLLSTAFFSYTGAGLGSLSRRIRLEQMQGTLESLFLTPTKTPVIIMAMSLWNILFSSFDLLIYIIMGKTLFNVDYSHVNLISAIVLLFLTVVSFSSIGIISACFILIFKRGNVLGWIINQLEGVIGGVYFPVTVLPDWLQYISRILPITYAVRGMQLAVYRGYNLSQLKREIFFLTAFSVVLVPVSILIFKKALYRTRIRGTLGQY